MLNLILLATLMAMAWPRVAMAQQNVVTEEAYWQLIAEIHTEVNQLRSATEANASQRLRALTDPLAVIKTVELTSGAQVAVDHTFLAALLRADPPDLNRLDGFLTTLVTMHDHRAAAPFPSVDPTQLQQIFERPEFRWASAEPAPWIAWLQEQWERFLRWLDGLLPDQQGGGVTISPLLEQIIMILLLLLLAGLLAYALRGILADIAAESALAAEDELSGEPLTADSALRRAQELSGGGDYRSAVRYLYLSTLLRLEERGLFRYDRSLTNREYLQRVAHDPGLATVLHDVVEVFDRVWYGFEQLDGAAYQHYATRVEALKHYRA